MASQGEKMLHKPLILVRKIGAYFLFFLFILNAACGEDAASTSPEADGTTFTVTMETKTDEHPDFGQGSALGFTIDGLQGNAGDALVLQRGNTYFFAVNSETGHPFYLTSDDSGGSGAPGEITDGVSNSQITSGTLEFTPNANHPDLIYYQCAAHENMGWEIELVD